jgi:uncharacterized membrane protein YfcA
VRVVTDAVENTSKSNSYATRRNNMNLGLIGGIVGSVLGIAGGIFGTYCSIKNTKSPRERSFMIKSSVVCWGGILVFLALLFALPNPYIWFMWIPYTILLSIGIIYGNRTQQRIRREESQNNGVKPIR